MLPLQRHREDAKTMRAAQATHEGASRRSKQVDDGGSSRGVSHSRLRAGPILAPISPLSAVWASDGEALSWGGRWWQEAPGMPLSQDKKFATSEPRCLS